MHVSRAKRAARGRRTGDWGSHIVDLSVQDDPATFRGVVLGDCVPISVHCRETPRIERSTVVTRRDGAVRPTFRRVELLCHLHTAPVWQLTQWLGEAGIEGKVGKEEETEDRNCRRKPLLGRDPHGQLSASTPIDRPRRA